MSCSIKVNKGLTRVDKLNRHVEERLADVEWAAAEERCILEQQLASAQVAVLHLSASEMWQVWRAAYSCCEADLLISFHHRATAREDRHPPENL